jgi:hypothetical protein
MATTGRSVASERDATGVLADAEFVRVSAAPTGGSVAAAAMLAEACDGHGVPFQVRVVRGASSLDATDASHVSVGFSAGDAALVFDADAVNAAFDAARELGASPDPVLAFAGAVADGREPSSAVREAAGLDRRPGVGVPTADLAAGLAFSTRVHASYSGDEQAAGAALAELALPAELDESARRRLASAVTLDATGDAPASAADAVADALRPHATPDAEFETVEGVADVLGALAWTAPGLGVALAQGVDVRAAAVDAWREHAQSAHATVRVADPTRYSGVAVADATEAHPTVARLVRDYRTEEAAALAVGDGTVALATTDADARAVLPGSVGTETLAVTETGDEDALVETVRGEL